MPDVLDRLLAERPYFHKSGTLSLSLGRPGLRELDSLVAEGANTLETGAGDSTILFASKGCRHTVVTPAADEVEAIRAYCEAQGIGLERVEFVVSRSEDYLPTLEREDLDFVLIDGHHAFPTPFLDWQYTADRLRVGGKLWIDNTEIWTGRVLRDFLKAEPGWRVVSRGRTYAVAEKTEPLQMREWRRQPYTRRRSGPWRRWFRLKWGGLKRRLAALRRD
jgi:Methyltransferase domain